MTLQTGTGIYPLWRVAGALGEPRQALAGWGWGRGVLWARAESGLSTSGVGNWTLERQVFR